ncbi:hypothetical protein BDW74DRAFT_184739 [Aspergillus multicolor]|uniref:cytochrome P450 n=1 Tax=Aspergillus multicolor TaxID=41759 RepID=UPI003CCDEEC0
MIDSQHLLLIGAVTVLLYILSRQSLRLDPREPPKIHARIPLIGHILGLLQHGMGYFSLLAKQNPTDQIFTINLLGNRQYIITSPSLMQAVQRNKKTLSFAPFVPFTAERLAGIHEEGMKLLRDKESGGAGLSSTTVHAMEKTLIGRPLDAMNEKMAKSLAPLVDELATTHNGKTVDLYAWATRAITSASTVANYGPANPYSDPAIAETFWVLERNVAPLLAGFLPSIVARTAYTAREKVLAAFIMYFTNGGYEQGSELTRTRYHVMHEGGLSVPDIARAEVSMGLGLLSNTVPAAFWVLFDLYSRPELLEETRAEVRANAVRVETTIDGIRKHIIDICALRDACPLFVSTYQEILRSRSTTAVTRVVTEDTILADRYLLKKGGVVSIPASTLGADETVWGPESEIEFNPRRYIKPAPGSMNGGERNPRRTGGFMTFGVSPTICPGRHFASSEILAIAAMVILRVDLNPVNGEWKAPERNSMAISSSMWPIKGELRVKVSRRDSEQEKEEQWDVGAREGSGMFNLMIG